MIYTVTLNPALDYVMRVPRFETGAINRSEGEAVFPGGKGVNVAIMLNRLGVSSTALGFSAGFTGRELCRLLEEEGVAARFTEAAGRTRINVKIRSEAETDCNGQGPEVTPEHFTRLLRELSKAQPGDTVVLAGAPPKGLPENAYARILQCVRGVHLALDLPGSLLRSVLVYRPLVVKPNLAELSEAVGKELSTLSEISEAAEELRELGARNVLVSLAGRGALLLAENGSKAFREPPAGSAVDSVGAGDSMLAGFLAGLAQARGVSDSFRLSVAAGSATAFTEGLARADEVMRLYALCPHEQPL